MTILNILIELYFIEWISDAVMNELKYPKIAKFLLVTCLKLTVSFSMASHEFWEEPCG